MLSWIDLPLLEDVGLILYYSQMPLGGVGEKEEIASPFFLSYHGLMLVMDISVVYNRNQPTARAIRARLKREP